MLFSVFFLQRHSSFLCIIISPTTIFYMSMFFIICIIVFLKSWGKSGWDLTSKKKKKKKHWSVFHNLLTRYPLTTAKTPLPKTQFNSTNIYSGPTIKCAQEGKLSLAFKSLSSQMRGTPIPQKRLRSQSLGLLFISWNNSSAFSPSIFVSPQKLWIHFTKQLFE